MDLMEHVRRPMVDGVRLQVIGNQSESVEGGTMCVTPFHLIFSTRRKAEDELTVNILCYTSLPHTLFVFILLYGTPIFYLPLQILHTSIDHIEHKAVTTNALVYLKDFRRLYFEYQSPEDCQDMVDALEVLSKPCMCDFHYMYSLIVKGLACLDSLCSVFILTGVTRVHIIFIILSCLLLQCDSTSCMR